jgi:hypothetical protein
MLSPEMSHPAGFRRSTAPPAAGTRQKNTLPESERLKLRVLPSGDQSGGSHMSPTSRVSEMQ